VTATIVPFPRRYERGIDEALEAYMRRERERICADCEAIRIESERVRAGYVERQARIERLLEHYQRQWERA
jgi:hypothetical protein